jgi:hypothetical protein
VAGNEDGSLLPKSMIFHSQIIAFMKSVKSESGTIEINIKLRAIDLTEKDTAAIAQEVQKLIFSKLSHDKSSVDILARKLDVGKGIASLEFVGVLAGSAVKM